MSNKNFFNTENSILEKLESDDWIKRGIELYIKRDDLIHPLVSGNKWRKLKHNVIHAQANNYKGILTFGGAFSNHLIATASACEILGFKAIGMVRGDELNSTSNDTLKSCVNLGMKLIFLSRNTYKNRNNIDFQNELKSLYSDYFIVPEGGANLFGILGCKEILKEIPFTPDHIFVAQGTSTTSCGILLSKAVYSILHVVPVLKGDDSYNEMLNLLNLATLDEKKSMELLSNVHFHNDYHFGAYGKYTPPLIDFIKRIKKLHKLPLDHVYTGKVFYALFEELKKPIYDNKKIVFIHTGGLQGSPFWKEV